MYYEEMKKMEEQLPGFYYMPTLSREEWEGHTGYVHNIYERICENRTPANFYLCGWKFMVDEAKENLVGMGYDKKDIHVELYG
jgi:CDP-4-dehydro-6-deoxyglucose reductase